MCFRTCVILLCSNRKKENRKRDWKEGLEKHKEERWMRKRRKERFALSLTTPDSCFFASFCALGMFLEETLEPLCTLLTQSVELVTRKRKLEQLK